MITLVALYRGSSVTEAELVCVSTDPALVLAVANCLLDEEDDPADPVLAAKRRGERRTLRLVRAELLVDDASPGGGRRPATGGDKWVSE